MRQMLHRLRSSFGAVGVLAVAAAMAYQHYHRSKLAAADAVTGLETSRLQADEIQRIRLRPVFATTTIEQVRDITRRIGQARALSGISEQSIDLVDPHPPIRIGESSYRQRPVAIDLRGLTLQQAAQFTDALTDRASGLWVNHFRISPVRGDSDGDQAETWNVELVLTQINYSPKSQ